MREHRYTLELPHPAARLWALFQDYDRWADYAPMVVGVEVLWPGDDAGNGLLRRVIYRMPLGRTGSALEMRAASQWLTDHPGYRPELAGDAVDGSEEATRP